MNAGDAHLHNSLIKRPDRRQWLRKIWQNVELATLLKIPHFLSCMDDIHNTESSNNNSTNNGGMRPQQRGCCPNSFPSLGTILNKKRKRKHGMFNPFRIQYPHTHTCHVLPYLVVNGLTNSHNKVVHCLCPSPPCRRTITGGCCSFLTFFWETIHSLFFPCVVVPNYCQLFSSDIGGRWIRIQLTKTVLASGNLHFEKYY